MQKEKISDKQFLLVVNGPSCGGKSTVCNVLFEQYNGIFNAKGDTIKWLISNYESKTYRTLVHEMVAATMHIALSHNLSVIKEGALYEPEQYIDIAKQANVPIFFVNVEAPWEILTERFEKRIEAKQLGNKKIANTDPVRLKELYDMYLETKMQTELNFDSSKQNPEEIADEVVRYIKKHLD